MSEQTPKIPPKMPTADGAYTPERLDLDKYSVQTYLYDTNQLLSEISQRIKILTQVIATAIDEQDQRSQKERMVRTIGNANRN